MDEQRWMIETDPLAMLNHLKGRASDRKLRLYAVSCCRRIWDLIPKMCRVAVRVAERVAEGNYTSKLLADAYDRAEYVIRENDMYWYSSDYYPNPYTDIPSSSKPEFSELEVVASRAVMGCTAPHAWDGACTAASYVRMSFAMRNGESRNGNKEVMSIMCNELRDIFGTFSFSPVELDLTWLTAEVQIITRMIFDSRNFAAMPMLADALQMAGCKNVVVLDHCRGLMPHVRGCWVVDLLLGKN